MKTSQQTQTTPCSEDDSAREHFDELANLRQQLAAMGRIIPDSKCPSILMGSLPELYTALLGSIAAAAGMSGTAASSAVVVKITATSTTDAPLESEKTKDEAFTADSQKKKRGPKRDVECKHCQLSLRMAFFMAAWHKKGHTKDQCWGGGGEGGESRED